MCELQKEKLLMTEHKFILLFSPDCSLIHKTSSLLQKKKIINEIF